MKASRGGYSKSTIRLISRELKKIRTTMGAITMDNVLLVARDVSHPLHRFFDWDDAKMIVRSMEITISGPRLVVNFRSSCAGQEVNHAA